MAKGDFGKVIRARRKELGITGEELAKKVGVVRTYISKIESKGSLPSFNLMKKIEKALKYNLAGLYLQEKNSSLVKQNPSLLFSLKTFHTLNAEEKGFGTPKKEAMFIALNKLVVKSEQLKTTKDFEKEITSFLNKFSPKKNNDKKVVNKLVKTLQKLAEEEKIFWKNKLNAFEEIINLTYSE
jgi:transcriptional regulator with XRE-family HTH domain